MPSVCAYFQVHQPYRLRPFSFFDKSGDYFNNALNREVMQRVAARCYIPANQALLKIIKATRGTFKVTFSITGTAIEQMREYAPEALKSFQELARTGCVEFLGETYHHSLASLYSPTEFREQVLLHQDLMQTEFRCRPRIFRNTELIYSDSIGAAISDLGFKAVLAEGVDEILGWRSPNSVYRVVGRDAALLTKNYALSDDIAFRFATSGENGGTLTPEVFVARMRERAQSDDVVGIFLDYETFGEHHREESGILRFLTELPACVLADSSWKFLTPSDVIQQHKSVGELSYPRHTSWADCERDVSAWRGNEIQRKALDAIYAYTPDTEERRQVWRKLQTSDHFYYMATKEAADSAVHSYFSPFESPYEAFIAFANVARDLGAAQRG